MKRKFTDAAHEDPDPGDVIEFLTDQGFTVGEAAEYERRHRPLYEVIFEFEYDTETHDLKVLQAKMPDGTVLLPAPDRS